MQTILLNVLHPSGGYQAPVHVPSNYTVAQLLQYLTDQAYLAPGAYHLVAKGVPLFSTQAIGQSGLQQNEVVKVIVEPVRQHFEGGRGKGGLLRNTINQYADEPSQPEQSQARPAKKSLLAWLFS